MPDDRRRQLRLSQRPCAGLPDGSGCRAAAEMPDYCDLALRPDGRSPTRQRLYAARKARMISVLTGLQLFRGVICDTQGAGNSAFRPSLRSGSSSATEMVGIALRDGSGVQISAGHFIETRPDPRPRQALLPEPDTK